MDHLQGINNLQPPTNVTQISSNVPLNISCDFSDPTFYTVSNYEQSSLMNNQHAASTQSFNSLSYVPQYNRQNLQPPANVTQMQHISSSVISTRSSIRSSSYVLRRRRNQRRIRTYTSDIINNPLVDQFLNGSPFY